MERHDAASAAIRASQALAELFFGALASGSVTMESFEDEVLTVGHAIMAQAMAAALEHHDWIGNPFLDKFQRARPAFLNSTGLM